MNRSVFRSPYFVMGVAAAMYALKILAKVSIGLSINSPMVYGEGLHNGADLVIVGLGVMVMLVSSVKMPRYAHGLIKLRNFGQLLTGAMLGLTAAYVAGQGLAGALSFWPSWDAAVRRFLPLPAHEAVAVRPGHVPILVAVLSASILLSWLVGSYQVKVGRATKNATVVADGTETICDGRVEAAVLAGVLGENLLHLRWLEYPAALLVAGLLAKTSFEIVKEGFDELMQKKLDKEIEDALAAAVMAVPGVIGIADMMTYAVGHTAVVEIKVRTVAPAAAHDELRFAIKGVLRPILAAFGFSASRKVLSFHKPKRVRSCTVVAIVSRDGVTVAAPTFAAATALRRIDVENEANERIEDFPLPPDLTGWLAEKHIGVVRAGSCTPDELGRIEASGAAFEPTSSFTLASLDI